jgi:GNAT superfamily N-acetyltransferase
LASGSTYNKGRRSKHVFGLGLVVRRKNWRQGIGRAMMERFEEEALKVTILIIDKFQYTQ